MKQYDCIPNQVYYAEDDLRFLFMPYMSKMSSCSRHTDASEESTQHYRKDIPKKLCSWVNNRLNATNYAIC